MVRLRIITLISFLITTAIFLGGKENTIEEPASPIPVEWVKNNNPIYTPVEHIRGTDQTFLTYPEWFLVHSPAEQAEYFKTRSSTGFPYLGHIQQIWKSYYIVNKQILGRFDFNLGYHVMIMVIGVSTTVEYAIKSFYEIFIGKLTEPSDGYLTEEDRFNSQVTQDYVTFIEQTPWYEFDFKTRLIELWTKVPLKGKNLFRKWERRYYLTTDLGIKAIYGYLIKLATKSAYENPILGTVVITNNYTFGENKNIKVLKELEDKKTALMLPRYADFNFAINELAKENIAIKEIAGNNSVILITLLVSENWKEYTNNNYKVIFTQPVLTRPEEKRVAICVPVLKLNEVLNDLQKGKIKIEHVYDY